MHSSTTYASTLPTLDDHEIDKISAYYSLAFPNFTYYLQTLTVTIGRRPIPSSGSSSDASSVDVDLGPLKSVSRLHARIEYEEEEERFVLVVLGRNGAWVDGIWAGSGSKVPLGARSQIQIATRTFHFILPPPPAPESTSLSSPPSTARQRSPSVDITSLSPGSSHPASPILEAVNTSVPDNPKPTTSKPAKSSKKRKRQEPEQPLPENMPPKPLPTYAVMCYRAITSLGGKATLQDVVQWMIDNYEWYKLNMGGPWENSIRHNLSSNRAFRNAARSSEERGKGFIWSIDPQYESVLRDQDTKARLAEQAQQQSHGANETQTPLPKTEPRSPQQSLFTKEPRLISTKGKKGKNSTDFPPVFTRTSAETNMTPTPAASTSNTPSQPSLGVTPNVPGDATSSSVSSVPQIPPNVVLPIVVGPLPDTHPTASATAVALAASSPSMSAVLTAPPIVLHSGTLILNPAVFSHLTASQLKELEGLGAQKALEILQSYIVRFLKESKRLERSKGRGRGRGRGGSSIRGSVKGRPAPENGSIGARRVEQSEFESAKGHQLSAEVPVETNSPSMPLLAISLPEVTTTGPAEGTEEPAVKKRKLANTEDLGMNGNLDVEIDVVGT